MNSNNKFVVVSYYTEGTIYEKEALTLKASCENFGLQQDIVGVSHQGSWCKNACMKASFLLEKLEEHNKPLVWTDADSSFMQYPEIFDRCRADMGIRINDTLSFDHNAKMLTGTLFINNTLSSKKLLNLWKKECERQLASGKTDVFDQVCLKNVILHYPTIVEIRRLPPTYCVICDHPDTQTISSKAVVVHTQASRIGRPIADGELAWDALEHLDADQLRQMRTHK